MADFNTAYNIVRKIEGGYQNNANDSGNYCDGELIGTNRGIAAETYADSLLGDRCPTVAEMKALTSDQAKSIYRTNFWNPIRGDELENQNTANMLFDMYVNQTYWFNYILENAVIKQRMFITSFDRPLSDGELDILNGLNQKKFFNDLRDGREERYNYLVEQNPAKYAEFYNGWMNRLDTLEWNKNWATPVKFATIALIILAVGVGAYFVAIHKYKRK